VKAIVLGAGVCGLSCAERLLANDFEVEVWARERQLATTSTVAGAIWYPFHANPIERVRGWAFDSLERYGELAREPQSGVVMRSGCEVFRADVEPQGWLRELPALRELEAHELPRDCARGFEFQAPVVETPVYMAWLEQRVQSLGATLHTRSVLSFEEVFARAPLVVDAAGLGARELAQDSDLHAVAGQVVRVEQVGLERFWFDSSGTQPTYVIPRAHDVVLGGSLEDEDADDASRRATLEGIRARCSMLEPRLAGARELGTARGLRPARSVVRLEAESPRPGRLLVHDYGHGGAGITLAWGCAEEVASIARKWRTES
jgi:D-amino-acid oxidase